MVDELRKIRWRIFKIQTINIFKGYYSRTMELLIFVRKILKITKFYSMGLALLAVPFTLMWFFTNNPVFLIVGIGYLIVAYILFVTSIGINKYSQILAEDKVKIFAYSAKDIVDRVLIECKLNPLKNKSDKHD